MLPFDFVCSTIHVGKTKKPLKFRGRGELGENPMRTAFLLSNKTERSLLGGQAFLVIFDMQDSAFASFDFVDVIARYIVNENVDEMLNKNAWWLHASLPSRHGPELQRIGGYFNFNRYYFRFYYLSFLILKLSRSMIILSPVEALMYT